MTEQRIDTGADAATGPAADPSEGLGLGNPEVHADPLDPTAQRSSGGDTDMPQPRPDEPSAAGGDDADTEGVAGLRDAYAQAGDQQRDTADLSGRQPSAPTGGSGDGPTSGTGGSERPARAETGEVSAEPSRERRREDPGSVASEFGDRADSAPEDDIAHPSI